VQQLLTVVVGQVYTASVYLIGKVGGENFVLQAVSGTSPTTSLGYVGIIATTTWKRFSFTFLATSTTGMLFRVVVLLCLLGYIYCYCTSSSPVTRTSTLERVYTPLPGLLVEPSRTNLVRQSNSFSLLGLKMSPTEEEWY
jgi:predicted CDP-diglyceride synthetase/phosphatidate cytidylyltransferase